MPNKGDENTVLHTIKTIKTIYAVTSTKTETTA